MTSKSTANVKDIGTMLVNDVGWSSTEASKLWAIGLVL
jgi:hypothetical protein